MMEHVHPSAPVVLDEDQGIIRTRTAWLTQINDPLLTPPWGVDRIHAHEVLTAVTRGQGTHAAHPDALHSGPSRRDPCRECDITRIAYFVANHWDTPAIDPHPVVVDLGVFDFVPAWPVVDGNHRLAAALVRGDEFIDVSTAGDWDRCIAVLIQGMPLWDLV